MKKIFKNFMMASSIIFAIIISSVSAYADEDERGFYIGAGVALNSQAIILDEQEFVPIRTVFELLGGEVVWDRELRQINIEFYDIDFGYTEIILTIDSNIVFVNAEEIILDRYIKILDGIAIAPVYFITNYLYVDVLFLDDFPGTFIDLNDELSLLIFEASAWESALELAQEHDPSITTYLELVYFFLRLSEQSSYPIIWGGSLEEFTEQVLNMTVEQFARLIAFEFHSYPYAVVMSSFTWGSMWLFYYFETLFGSLSFYEELEDFGEFYDFVMESEQRYIEYFGRELR
ncbi:MAG: copper amine oxidase N-terminal domain-containing protein [Defluviitaleaceae bacterium]|nr:copper amine oxidase N-terminal domain-containing protein [Defluviitaleaceae bacterium]